MNIIIKEEHEEFLKERFGVTDIKPIVQNYTNDWIAHLIRTSFKTLKTTDEQATEFVKLKKDKKVV